MEERTEKLIKLLTTKQVEIKNLKKDLNKNKVYQWKNEVLMILDNLITEESRYYKRFNELNFGYSFFVSDPDMKEHNRKKFCQDDLERAYVFINSIIYGVKNDLL
jgi:hypothetical protein